MLPEIFLFADFALWPLRTLWKKYWDAWPTFIHSLWKIFLKNKRGLKKKSPLLTCIYLQFNNSLQTMKGSELSLCWHVNIYCNKYDIMYWLQSFLMAFGQWYFVFTRSSKVQLLLFRKQITTNKPVQTNGFPHTTWSSSFTSKITVAGHCELKIQNLQQDTIFLFGSSVPASSFNAHM